MFSRHLQDVFKMYNQVKLFLLTRLQEVVETYSTRFLDILRRRLFTERFALVTLLRNLWSGYKIFKSELLKKYIVPKVYSLYIFMKWLLPQTKTLLLKSGVRKNVFVSVNDESINKSSSKTYFSGFNFSLYCTFQWLVLETYLEPGQRSTMKLFLWKYETALSCLLFPGKSSIADARLAWK